MEEKIRVIKGSVEETFLLPPRGRACETQRANLRLVDKKAVEIIARIDCDFTEIAKMHSDMFGFCDMVYLRVR